MPDGRRPDPLCHATPRAWTATRAASTLDALRGSTSTSSTQFGDPETLTRISQYELAFRMQMSVPEVMDIKREPENIRTLYGAEPGASSFANNCLLARRLVERGVRYVQLFDWGWDFHGTDNTNDIVEFLPKKCREVDRPIAALLKDLKHRGLLDETLVIWGGEFGRTSMNEARGGSTFLGRDHHPHCFTIWLAGGGHQAGDRLRGHRRARLPRHRRRDDRPRPPGDDPPPARPRRLEAALPLPGLAAAADRAGGRGQGAAGDPGVRTAEHTRIRPKDRGGATMATQTTRTASGLVPYRLTVRQFLKMIEANLFREGDRVELLGGLLLPMTTHDPHDFGVAQLAQLLRPTIASGLVAPRGEIGAVGPLLRPVPTSPS